MKMGCTHDRRLFLESYPDPILGSLKTEVLVCRIIENFVPYTCAFNMKLVDFHITYFSFNF